MVRALLLLFAGFCFLVQSSTVAAEGEPERDYEVAMTKGLAELQSGNAAAAIEFFRQARLAKPKDQNAALSLGIAVAKTGDLAGAKATLQEAQAIDPADPRTQYELGLVLERLGEREKARGLFETAAASPEADSALRNAARDSLARTAEPGAAAGLRFTVLAGLQYDSNVILEPALPAPLLKEKKADWAAIISAEGLYRAPLSRETSWEAGYQLYQSLHNKLEDYNIQQHTLKASVRNQAAGSTAFGGRYAFHYTLVGGSEHYSTSNELMPYIETRFTPSTTTQFRYLFQNISYYDDLSFPLNSERSGMSHAIGITHSVQWESSLLLSASYDYTAGSADKEYWSYKEHRGQIALQKSVGAWTCVLSAAYTDQRYDAVVTGYPEARHDGMQEYAAILSGKLSDRMVLSLSDSHIINDSNLAPFEYKRNIAGLFLGMRL